MPGSRKCNYVQDYDNAKANSQCQQIIIIIVIIGVAATQMMNDAYMLSYLNTLWPQLA